MMRETSLPVWRSSSPAIWSTSPSVALISKNCTFGSASSGTCQAQPRSESEKKWNSSIATLSMGASFPSASAWFARISSVQQMTGADVLMCTSPVIMPTFSRPKMSTRLKNFSLTSALMGAV